MGVPRPRKGLGRKLTSSLMELPGALGGSNGANHDCFGGAREAPARISTRQLTRQAPPPTPGFIAPGAGRRPEPDPPESSSKLRPVKSSPVPRARLASTIHCRRWLSRFSWTCVIVDCKSQTPEARGCLGVILAGISLANCLRPKWPAVSHALQPRRPRLRKANTANSTEFYVQVRQRAPRRPRRPPNRSRKRANPSFSPRDPGPNPQATLTPIQISAGSPRKRPDRRPYDILVVRYAKSCPQAAAFH